MLGPASVKRVCKLDSIFDWDSKYRVIERLRYTMFWSTALVDAASIRFEHGACHHRIGQT